MPTRRGSKQWLLLLLTSLRAVWPSRWCHLKVPSVPAAFSTYIRDSVQGIAFRKLADALVMLVHLILCLLGQVIETLFFGGAVESKGKTKQR